MRGVGIKATFDRFEAWLEGWPNGVLTLVLLLAAGVLVLIAFKGRAAEKALAMAYVLFP